MPLPRFWMFLWFGWFGRSYVEMWAEILALCFGAPGNPERSESGQVSPGEGTGLCGADLGTWRAWLNAQHIERPGRLALGRSKITGTGKIWNQLESEMNSSENTRTSVTRINLWWKTKNFIIETKDLDGSSLGKTSNRNMCDKRGTDKRGVGPTGSSFFFKIWISELQWTAVAAACSCQAKGGSIVPRLGSTLTKMTLPFSAWALTSRRTGLAWGAFWDDWKAKYDSKTLAQSHPKDMAMDQKWSNICQNYQKMRHFLTHFVSPLVPHDSATLDMCHTCQEGLRQKNQIIAAVFTVLARLREGGLNAVPDYTIEVDGFPWCSPWLPMASKMAHL